MHIRKHLICAIALLFLLVGLPAQAQADAEDVKNGARNCFEPVVALVMSAGLPVVAAFDTVVLTPVSAATDGESWEVTKDWYDQIGEMWGRAIEWD